MVVFTMACVVEKPLGSRGAALPLEGGHPNATDAVDVSMTKRIVQGFKATGIRLTRLGFVQNQRLYFVTSLF
jgi:hypothetical protein